MSLIMITYTSSNCEKDLDSEYDIFNYNFNGRRSGKFVIEQSGNILRNTLYQNEDNCELNEFYDCMINKV